MVIVKNVFFKSRNLMGTLSLNDNVVTEELKVF